MKRANATPARGPEPPEPFPPPIRAVATAARVARRYELLSPIYAVNAALGSAASREAIGRAGPGPGDRVLDLAVGTGRDSVRLAELVGETGIIVGVDLSLGMLRVARRTVSRSGCPARVGLVAADGARLALPDAAVDVVFSSRLLDLVDTPSIPALIDECRRVLRPGGRIVLVNMSKPDGRTTMFERMYAELWGFAGWLFVSRPVLAAPFLAAAGFRNIERTYRRGWPCGTEIVTATRAPRT